jgi:hypothetical protein
MKRTAVLVCSIAIAAAPFALAANDPRQLQDLSSVIALHGKPCGEVVSYVVQGDNDFLATCKDGNRYRVHVQDGRVVVEKK